MIKTGDDTIRNVSWLSDSEEKRILDFLQGALYCWCNTKANDWFSVPLFMGGDNREDWNQTPLGILYDKHITDGKTHKEAWDLAGQESGLLLKKVVKLDKRSFETKEAYPARQYRWVKD
jgi:hypothetical protein